MNKHSKKFVKNTKSEKDGEGSKWSLTALKKHYAQLGIDVDKVQITPRSCLNKSKMLSSRPASVQNPSCSTFTPKLKIKEPAASNCMDSTFSLTATSNLGWWKSTSAPPSAPLHPWTEESNIPSSPTYWTSSESSIPLENTWKRRRRNKKSVFSIMAVQISVTTPKIQIIWTPWTITTVYSCCPPKTGWSYLNRRRSWIGWAISKEFSLSSIT